MDSEAPFSIWLRWRRRTLDLTQAELAEQAGCSVATIRKLEADETRPSKQLAARLADCLEIPPEGQGDFVTFARARPGTAPLSFAPLPAGHAPWTRTLARTNNLPAPLTPLIGRGQDVAAAGSALLRGDTRLLTLVGPAGIGKTRLSLQVAAEMAPAFSDGVCFVDLAPIRDPFLVAPTIAQALAIRESGNQLLADRLQTYLKDKRVLLVLDNFEHVPAAATLVVQWLERCPGLKVMVTGRSSLRIRGEREYPVTPLLVPFLNRLPDLEALASYPALALFVDRARAADPAFRLDEGNAATVAAICARIDGLPLAIELAAAWNRLLPPDELLARLNSRLTLLTGGPLDLPVRQRALKGVIGWSYDLLGAAEQSLFGRLAVFVGGWTQNAAGAICGAEQAGEELFQTSLSFLAAKSLLVRRAPRGGETRFSMLESIHEYALERLEESGELATYRQRHAAYYLALAEAAEPNLRGPAQRDWLERLEVEHNNLRAAMEWALQQPDAEAALRLSGAIWRFWELRSHLSEGRGWLEAALAQSNAQARQGPLSRSHRLARARALDGAGKLASDQGEPETGQTLCEESLALWQWSGSEGEAGQIMALNCLGLIAQSLGDYRRAMELHQRCLNLAQRIGDRVGAYQALYNLGEIALAHGDLTQATRLHEESLAHKREQGDSWSIAWSLASLAFLALDRGALDEAAVLLRESLTIRWELGDKWSTAESLTGLASIAALTHDPERAIRLFAVAESLLKATGASLSAYTQQLHDRHLAGAHSQLEEGEHVLLWSHGRGMPMERAIRYALEQ